MITKKRNKICLYTILILFLSACTQNSIFFSYQHIPDNGWDKNSSIVFNPIIEDTTATYRVHLYIRNDNRYQYRNLWLLLRYQNQNDSIIQDTIDCSLANEQSVWKGGAWGSLHELKIPLPTLLQFSHSGKKEIAIQQCMPGKAPISGITEIGIDIFKEY